MSWVRIPLSLRMAKKILLLDLKSGPYKTFLDKHFDIQNLGKFITNPITLVSLFGLQRFFSINEFVSCSTLYDYFVNYYKKEAVSEASDGSIVTFKFVNVNFFTKGDSSPEYYVFLSGLDCLIHECLSGPVDIISRESPNSHVLLSVVSLSIDNCHVLTSSSYEEFRKLVLKDMIFPIEGRK